MPIYEYKCDKCGVFEVTQRITENPLKKCPTCKSKVERMLSRSSFVLKGSGWYATDYGRKASSESTSESSSSTTNGTSKSTESKSTESKSKESSSSSPGSDKPAAKSAD